MDTYAVYYQRPTTGFTFLQRDDLTVADLEHGETGERWFSVGCASNGAMLSVVYLWSDADPAATNIRMISARKSTQTEIRQYQECS